MYTLLYKVLNTLFSIIFTSEKNTFLTICWQCKIKSCSLISSGFRISTKNRNQINYQLINGFYTRSAVFSNIHKQKIWSIRY